MPLDFRNCQKSSLTKQLPLSETIVSGIPNCAKTEQRSSMVTLAKGDVAGKASVHLE